jgi:hypothetical protein
MSNSPAQFLSEIFSIRFGDMIASVGEGIATAQAALDQASLEATLAVYSDTADSDLKLLREIGYQPTFYAIPKASGKMMVALSMFSETTAEGQRLRLMASPLNPTLSNKYSYSGSASAEVAFDIVPVPPNEQIRRVPDVVGEAGADAGSKLRDLGLDVDFVDSAGAPIPVAGHRSVTLQMPSNGSIVKIGTLVTLTLDAP